MRPRLSYETEVPATGKINLTPQIDEQAHLSNQLRHFLLSVQEEGIPPTVAERSYKDIRIGKQVLTRLGLFYKREEEQPLSATVAATHQPVNGRPSNAIYTLTRDQQHWLHGESASPQAKYEYLSQTGMLEEMLDRLSEHYIPKLNYMVDFPVNAERLVIALEKDLGKSAHYRKESDTYHADLAMIDTSNDYAYVASRHISIQETRMPKVIYRQLAVQALLSVAKDADVIQQISLTDKIHAKTGALIDQDLQLSLSSHELQPLELTAYAKSSEYALSGTALNALYLNYQELEAQTFLRAA